MKLTNIRFRRCDAVLTRVLDRYKAKNQPVLFKYSFSVHVFASASVLPVLPAQEQNQVFVCSFFCSQSFKKHMNM